MNARSEKHTTRSAVVWTVATVLVPLALSWILVSAYLGPWYQRTGHRGSPPADVLLPALLDMVGPSLWITVGLWWLMFRAKDSFAALFATRTRSIAGDVALGVALGAAWIGIYGLVRYPPFDRMFLLDAAKLRSVPLSLSAGFCEEFLFRGFVILMIARAGGSRTAQILWSSLAFGLGHVHWGPWGMLWTTGLGLSFAGARTARGSVWPAVVAHSILNLAIEPGMLQLAMQTNGQ